MRSDPVSESFRLGVDDPDEAFRLVRHHAARRGKVLEDSPAEIVFRVGSSLVFLLLGTFYERGRRSIPVKVTVMIPRDRTTPSLHLTMESQERGYLLRAPWLVAAFHGSFRDLYAELESVARSGAADA